MRSEDHLRVRFDPRSTVPTATRQFPVPLRRSSGSVAKRGSRARQLLPFHASQLPPPFQAQTTWDCIPGKESSSEIERAALSG